MNRRGKPPVFALTTFSLLAVAASVVLAFMAAEVYNFGAPAQVVGPNSTDVLAMDVFLADNPIQDVKIMPGERVSALGDNISYFDFTNGFAGYVNVPVLPGDAGVALPANTIFADRGNPGDNVPTGQDDQNVADEFWEDLNTNGEYDAGETEVWWEVEPVQGTRGFDLRAWVDGDVGFTPYFDPLDPLDVIYFKDGPGFNANTPMWIDWHEDGDETGVAGTQFEWETVIFPVGGGGIALDQTGADPTGPTFGDTSEREVWGDLDGDGTFDNVNDIIWNDDLANNLYDNEPIIFGAPVHGDVGTSFPANIMFENEDLDDVWTPATGEDLFEDTDGDGQWDVGETIFTGGMILAGAPGVPLSSLVPEVMFVDLAPPGFGPFDWVFIDTNGSGEYESETMMLGAAPLNGTAGTAFQDAWSFAAAWALIWDDADDNAEYDADLVIFGAPAAHLSDPDPVQPLLFNGDEEIFVDNIPAGGVFGFLSLDPDSVLNKGQDGVNAAHAAPLTFFPDIEGDGFERFADATAPIGDYNDGDEIFEDHDNSMTYTAQGDGIIGGDDGPDPVTWNVGDPLPLPSPILAFLDLNFDGLLSDNEPVVSESAEDNLTMDFGETVIANFTGPLTRFPSNVFMIDINGSGSFEGGEPIFENTNEDALAEPGETSLRTSSPGTIIPMTPFTNIEFFIGGLADYNDGDDIVEIVYNGSGGAHAGGDQIFNFNGPDGIQGVGGDDVLWYDTNNNGIFEPAWDDAFIDRNNNRRIDGGTEVPVLVGGGDSDVGDPVVPIIPFNFAYNDLDGNSQYFVGLEPCYVDINTNGVVNAGDRRILYHQPNATVGASDEDVGAAFAQFSNFAAPGPAQTIFLDRVVNGTWDLGEPVYYYAAGFAGAPNPALVSSDAVGAQVMRLNEVVFTAGGVAWVYPPLSLVHDGDQELVAPGALFEYFPPTAALGSVTYHDPNLNGVFNPGEMAYSEVLGGTGIHAGDVRIYSYPAGSVVAAGDADVAVALFTAFPPDQLAIRDGWGGTPNQYDPGEQVYGNNTAGRFAGYAPGVDGFNGFNVIAGSDYRLTNRPFEWAVIQGAGALPLGSALMPFTEDIIANGVLDANLDETALNEKDLLVDLNQDGDMEDLTVMFDINANGGADLTLHEDQNYDGILTGPHGNNLWARAPFTQPGFFPAGFGGAFFTPSQDIFRMIRDGNIADVLPGDPTFGLIKDIGGLIKHCDDGGRGYNPNFLPLYGGAGNLRYDDGETIIFDIDDDLRWDPGEDILTASALPVDPATDLTLVGAVPAVQQMRAFDAPAFIFADVQGGVANGLYDTEEAIIRDLDADASWDNGEQVILSSGDRHLSDFESTIMRRAPAGNDFVLDLDGGGTWSDGADTPRDLVDGLLNTAEGDPLTAFAADIGYHNVLDVNEYDDFENDEIFRDLDGDGLVTLLPDTEIYPQAGPFASANGDVLNQFVSVPPAPAGANRFVGWVDTGDGFYNGDAGDEEDIYYDVDGDGVVDERDDVMTDFALVNPLSANEPTDIVAVNLWMESGDTPGLQIAEDTDLGQGVVDVMDSRRWSWTGLSVPVLAEDRNNMNGDDDVLVESVWSIDFNGDGDLLDVVTEELLVNGIEVDAGEYAANLWGRDNDDSQTRMYAAIDISANPQNLLIGNQFDATIPLMGVETLALNNGPEDVVIKNSMGLWGGPITIDDYPPTVTRLEQLRLNDFDSDAAAGAQPPDLIEIYGHADNVWEVSGNVTMVFRTPSDNDVRRVKLLMATDEAGPWTPLDTDPDDSPADGAPGLPGVDDDGDWRELVLWGSPSLGDPGTAFLGTILFEDSNFNGVFEPLAGEDLFSDTAPTNGKYDLGETIYDLGGGGIIADQIAGTPLPAKYKFVDGGPPGFDVASDAVFADNDLNGAYDGTYDYGQDGIPLTGDVGEGNGVPDVGEPGVDLKDFEVARALLNPLNDFVDNNDDGYIDDFEFEPPGMDINRNGIFGEGFAVDINGNGVPGEPDPDAGTDGDSSYDVENDNDEDGIADMDGTEFMAQLVNDNFWNIPDSTMISSTSSPTMWSFTLNTLLMQYVLNGTTALPEYNDIFVKAVAYDQFGSVMPLYAAPSALRLDNLAPEVTVSMTTMLGVAVNDGDQVLDSETYMVGVTSSDDELMDIRLRLAKNDAATFTTYALFQDAAQDTAWSPDAVGNNPPDETDDYYWEGFGSDILGWWNETTQQWQPYAFDLDGDPATDPTFIGNMEMSALPACNPVIVQTCLLPPDVAELHIEALNSTAPLSAITIIEASPTEIRARGDFVDGVRVPAYNAILLFVDNEDVNENGLLNDGIANPTLNEANLDETADGVDYNKDGDMLDVGVAADLNFDGDMVDIINEDANGNGFLDDGIDDGDGQWWTSDIVGCVFEQTPVNETNWVPIQTVTGDTVGGVVQDLSYPVAVSWDTRDLADGEASYNLRVRSWDVENNWLDEGIEIVTVTVDAEGLNAYFNQDPSEVSGPTIDGSTVFGEINLYAYSVDPLVKRVLFRYSADGGVTWNDIGVNSTPDDSLGTPKTWPPDWTPYRDWYMSFDTSLFPDDNYLFDVVGLDEFGNSDEDPTDMGQQIAVTFMNTPPILAITSPPADTIVSMLNGNVILDLEADLVTAAAGGQIEAQFQVSLNGGSTWVNIDGVNSEAASPDWGPGDYFADNPRMGARMGAYNLHPTYAVVPVWLQDMVYRKGLANTDYAVVEVGDFRIGGNPWTDPWYNSSSDVQEGDQDVGTPLIPHLAPFDAGDAMDPAPERFGPWTTRWVSNAHIAHFLGSDEMMADRVVLLRVVATDLMSGLPGVGPTTEITVRENSDPVVDVIEVTDSAGGLVCESDTMDIEITNRFPGGFTFDDQITIFARSMDNTYEWTDQQGTVSQCQVFYRPRQVDYNYTGTLDWTAGPVDTEYPFIIAVDVSGLNGLYEFCVQATDEGGNTSGIYPQFSCVVQNMEATATGLPATINEGATITVGADATAGLIDSELPPMCSFYASRVVLAEELAPEFQTAGTYAGYFTAQLAENIMDEPFVDGADVPGFGAYEHILSDGSDVRVHVGGSAGVFHHMDAFLALAAPTPLDFTVDYPAHVIVFGGNPTASGVPTADYHYDGYVHFETDEIPPYTADLTPDFVAAGEWDIIASLEGTSGAPSPTGGIFSRDVGLSSDPGSNLEVNFAEWNILTVNDAEAPVFTVGGLKRVVSDGPEWAAAWTSMGGGPINLGNAVNVQNMMEEIQTVISGDELDIAIYETGETLDPATVAWTLRDAAGDVITTGPLASIMNPVFDHPITFTLFENDFAQVVMGDDIENVRLWLDFNGNNNWSSDVAEMDAEVFPLTDMGAYWQATVHFNSDADVEYMFLVDTIGNDLDFDMDGDEDPVDDPRNQKSGGGGFEIDQNNGGQPSDSKIVLIDNGYWANVDISALTDGVYFFDLAAADMGGNLTTYTKRFILDRTAFPQDFITVSTGDEMYVGAPDSTTTLFAKIIDPAVPGVNINDAVTVAFQYFDGVDWLWCNGGTTNASADAVDDDPTDGWSIVWTVPDPATDAKDNDGDGYVDETEPSAEGEFTVQLRAVVRDLGYNLSHTPASGLRDFLIDSIAPETFVQYAQTAADAAPTLAEGKVVTIGEWVDLFAPEPSNEAAVGVVFQYSKNANGPSTPVWYDLDCTPLDPDDDFMGFETPDYAADTDAMGTGTMYYMCRFDTELIRVALQGSGDLFAEVRALGIDATGNVGDSGGTTVLIMNDVDGPATVIRDIFQPLIGWRYVNDPTLAISGTPTVRTAAIGYKISDVATTTLQWSTTGGDDWTDWTTVGTQDPKGAGESLFEIDVSAMSGMLYLRAFSTDLDGNIGGDDDANGIIDAAEAGNLHAIAVMVDNDMPVMELMAFGAAGHGDPGLSDGDIVMPNTMPLETRFMPVLPQTIAVTAWDAEDGTVDAIEVDLQYWDDVTNPASPEWVTIADSGMQYRDDPGEHGAPGAPRDGYWYVNYDGMTGLVDAMSLAAGGTVFGPSEYRFRALAVSYSGMTNQAEEGVSLMVDMRPPDIVNIAVGDEDMEAGGGGIGLPPVHVAGGDNVPIQAYTPDSWADWVPGAGSIVEPELAWESSGIYGVRARVMVPGGAWETVGLMTLDELASLPATYMIDWQSPLNVAWPDTVFYVEISTRDEAGNYLSMTREDAIIVQDRVAPSGTEIVSIAAGPGDGMTFPNPVTETTIRTEGTQVRGEVTLTATTAGGDQSISATGSSVYFEVRLEGTSDWILINAASSNPSLPEGVSMEADMAAGGAHLGVLWNAAWNTMVLDGNGARIYPDGKYWGRAWAIDDWGNHELLEGVGEIPIWVDNTAPMAQMDADPYTEGVQTTATVERNDVFTAFARTISGGEVYTEDTSDDVTVEFMIKLSTDLNVASSWTRLAPRYDATDVNPDNTRPYSFDWWMNQNTPSLMVGADYHIAACAWDLLGSTMTEVEALDAGMGITISIVDTQAPVATITKLVRSIGDPTVITWPDEVCIVGLDSLEATILRGDSDTKFVRFYYRPEGETEWILANGDIFSPGYLTWTLHNWDSSVLPEGRYEFMARAEDDTGLWADGPAITLIINRTGPVFAAVSPESDMMPAWEPSLSAATPEPPTQWTPIAPVGPMVAASGRLAPTGSYTGSESRTYSITIDGAGYTGFATFTWESSAGSSGSDTTGSMVELEDGILVSFCDGTDTPPFEIGDVFTFHTKGKTVDLIVTTDVGMDDIDPSRIFFEYKRSDLPDIDANWLRDAVAPCGVLHDDMLNTWSSKWDISDLESCLYDIRLTMWDVCGNWTTAAVAGSVIVDNDCPPVAITNIENADKNDTTLEPIDFGQITDVTRGVPVEIWATATDDEPCLPESHETGVSQMQFQMSTDFSAAEGAAGGAWQDLGLYEVPDDAGDDPDVTASQLWDTSGLEEGDYYLRVRAWDDAGNICNSQVVQVNIVDKTPPLARIAGFDPDVLHGDDENTLERVYAMVYSDDEIVDVQFQYLLSGAERWVTFGMGTRVTAGSYSDLEQNNIPEVWASDFNLSDLVALTSVSVGGQFTLRAVAKDSDSNTIKNKDSDKNAPELPVTVVTSPIDGSLALCPGAASRITDMSMSSPRQDSVVVSVTTDAVDNVPRALVVWEDLTGADTAAILPMPRTIEIPSSTFQGNVSLLDVKAGGQVSIFATVTQSTSLQMATKNLVVHPVDDMLGSNGVAGLPRTDACMTYGALDASVMVPPGNGQSGGLYIGPASLDVPVMPESQGYYIERYGDAVYYIELFGAGEFTDGYEAKVVITYDDPASPDDPWYEDWDKMESKLMPRYWHGDDGWSAEGITHVTVDENEVSFRINNLGGHSHFSLFLPKGGAPIEVVDFMPWSEEYTDRDPVFKAMLRDVMEGGGVDEGSVEIWFNDRKVADSGGGYVLGTGTMTLTDVSGDGMEYELVYEHSTDAEAGDLLDGGMYDLDITYTNMSGKMYVLDSAAPYAAFGVDTTPVRYWWDPGTADNGETLNFVLGRDPVISLKIWDYEAGIHIQDVFVQGESQSDGIKMDVYKVETSRTEPDGPTDVYYARNLVQHAETDMLVFDPPIDEYDPAVHDTLTVSYPMYNANLDAWNSQELEVVIYTHSESWNEGEDPYWNENRYNLAVQDLVGNAGSEFVQHRYRIDVCGPSVEFVNPQCGTAVDPEEDVIVTIDLSDECDLCTGDCGDEAVFAGSGIDLESIRYEVMTPADTAATGRGAEVSGERITFTLPGPLALGEHTLTVWVSDILGNETQAECTFTVSSDDRLLADAYVYPNPLDPSNGGGTFVVNAGQAGAKVSIDVFDFAGNFVATVANDMKVTGWGFEIPWEGRAEDGTMLASGPYMARVRVENGDEVMSRTVKVMVWQLDHY